jgi:hypothetical protein
MNRNKASVLERDRRAIVGIGKHYATLPSIVLGGVAYPPSDVVKLLQEQIDAAPVTSAAKAAFHQAVSAERSAGVKADAVYLALKAKVLSDFKNDPSILDDFGMAHTTPQVPSAETVAKAVAKRASTRKARHTMGPRQKAEIKGDVPATPPPAVKPQP